LSNEPSVLPSERTIVFLVGAIQFVNILDFMMVMPLGPDFAKALGIASSHLGIIGGAYTAAAAVSGIIAARFLDRFDRRSALAVAMLGLVVGTASGALANGFHALVVARILAGAFGGPATSLSLSIIADVVPPARRGRAMGAVMGAFSMASVLGVPLGLWLARIGGWQVPFLVVAGFGVVVGLFALRAMPSLRGHIRAVGSRQLNLGSLLADRTIQLSLTMVSLVMLTAFLIIPNISAFLQKNFAYPRAGIELLYMIGGAISFVVLRLAGRAIDRFGAARVSILGTVMLVAVLTFGFVVPETMGSTGVMVMFVGFMVAMSIRNVCMGSLSTRVPRTPDERAGYMSLQSTAQHISSSLGAFASSRLLADGPGGRLVGMPRLALVSVALAPTLPPLLAAIGRRVRAREASALPATAKPPAAA
jgi:predicted MFS family arabinose efflux permease